MQEQQDERPVRPPILAVNPPSQEAIPQAQVPIASTSRRDMWYEDSNRLAATMVQRAEKDADDPNAEPAPAFVRQDTPTLTTLSRLFAVQAPASPASSRSPSYNLSHRPYPPYARNVPGIGTAALPDHLYTRGLLEGRHSDITVNAFGHQYKLHRLILDRAQFFRSALSEPWLESSAKETTVHPEDIDTNISQKSFDLALKRLYGCADPREEDANAVGLFATGCWLEMQDLIDCSIESMLRQMTPETLSPLIKLVTSNYYGRAGDKILASAKAMLCRDGSRMALRNWDGIPGDIIREIVGGDGFFIDGEWQRWVLSKKLLDRRLKIAAAEVGLSHIGRKPKLQKAPQTANLMAVRFDTVYRRNSVGAGQGISDSLQPWIALYTHPDVEPMLVLLDEGIHYVHLDFEQLQLIRKAKDVVGLPVMPEKVISNALWQQMELRQRVMNTSETNMELGLSISSPAESAEVAAHRDGTMSVNNPASPPASSKGKQKAYVTAEDSLDDDIDSGSWDGNGKPRKFWIPSSDCNIVMGGNADPIVATSNNTTIQRHASRHSATIQPEDVQWASDFAAATAQPRPTSSGDGLTAGEVKFSHFPPFRFAAEFPNPRLLKERKRVYSRTVFYAGSLWNIYIQKVASTRRKQLGVYLHRAKEREAEKVLAAGVAQGSVDERIGQLEREMIIRGERREQAQRRRAEEGSATDGGESAGSAADFDITNDTDANPSVIGSSNPIGQAAVVGASNMRNALGRGTHQKSGQQEEPDHSFLIPDPYDTSDSEDGGETDDEIMRASNRPHVPALPPYVDARPTIKTYFKIYSPSRGGRMLSVYESAPDTFNFSQSWGWMSSTLMLDDGILGDDDVVEDAESGSKPVGKGQGGDGKLRFMVVIGNV